MAPKKAPKKKATKKSTNSPLEEKTPIDLRNCCYTLNNFTDEDIEQLKLIPAVYHHAALEIGTEKEVPHLQGYIEFTGKFRFERVKKYVGNGTHFEPRFGTQLQADGYTKKGDSPDRGPKGLNLTPGNEYYCNYPGENYKCVILMGKLKKQGERTDVEDRARQLLDGEITYNEILANDPRQAYQYGRVYKELEDLHLAEQFRKHETKGIWVWGPAGLGKGNYCFRKKYISDGQYEHHWKPDRDFTWKYDGIGIQAWQDGYKGQTYVVINEFRGQLKLNELLTLVSADIMEVRRRGRAPAPWLPLTVVVNSCYPPKEVYINALDDREHWSQFERRFKVIEAKSKEQMRMLALTNLG